MSRHRSIRRSLIVVGLGAWIAASAGLAQGQEWGPYANPYSVAPYGGGPGYAPGYPAYDPGYSGYPNEQPLASDFDPALSTPAVDGHKPAPLMHVGGGSSRRRRGLLYSAGPEVAAAPNVHLDLAPVFTHFRLRLDAGWDNPTPDRAEYFQGKSGFFRTAAAPLPDPDAPGPRRLETDVDYQDLRGYLEVAVGPIFSGFVEMPYRFIQPEQNEDTSGFGDMNAGIKAALLATDEDFLTFQFTTYIPVGDADRGLGTSHATVEPAILFLERITDRLTFYGDGRYWIPIDGTDFAGQILRYGLGAGFDLGYGSRGNERVTALVETAGWTITHGGVFDGNNPAAGIQNAADDTIVNLVLGLRYTLGTGSVAASWSRPLTDPVWFDDFMRLEYRWAY
jgi:hypothetical protein